MDDIDVPNLEETVESMTHKIAVIGAAGFIGRYLVEDLKQAGYDVTEFSRDSHGDFHAVKDWGNLLKGYESVIHLAARVHRVHENKQDARAYHEANVELTDAVLKGAEKAGVSQFIFLSSAAVYGGSVDDIKHRYSEEDIPAPLTPYGQSKLEAERLMGSRSMRCVSIRAPMVYGKGCRANFLSLAKAIHKSIPLPLSRVHNKRSLLYVGNLSSFIQLALKDSTLHGVYNLADDEDLSTPELIRHMGDAMGKKPILAPFPVSVLSAVMKLAGMTRQRDGLLRSFRLNTDRAKSYGWQAPYSVDAGLKKSLDGFS